jgi:hypothetical protein
MRTDQQTAPGARRDDRAGASSNPKVTATELLEGRLTLCDPQESPSMRQNLNVRLVPALAAVLFLGLGACSKAGDSAAPGTSVGTSSSTAATGSPVGVAGPTTAACAPEVLVPVVQAKFGQAGVDHLVCLAPNAILTVKAPVETVAFLQQKAGTWTITADGPVADAETLLPKDFPLSIERSWQDKRNPETPSPPTSARPGTGAASTVIPGATCTGEGANQTCTSNPPPTLVPTTPKPTTTKAPVTEPPTTAPAPPTTFSQFCLENPLDPSCSGKK